ncbi:amidase [Rhodopseudomonas sp. HC1]|uniref:amidase n=1 Tax=Rhodopseudomonas infernalis TaxID=2897386 RepID=UPI001EE97743|nr:amidase [Rhodopseudomonas infernalis]MCG6205426.1 amidase [Rhodopseudomonas infernalis]
MTADLHYKSIVELSDLYRRKELKPSEVTQASLDRIAQLDKRFNAYMTVLGERALQHAHRADDEIAKGIDRGPLHGVPIGLKDLCYTSFAPTGGGTMIHAKFVPSFNATVVDRLELGGAISIGKLKMTEGAYTSHHPDDTAPLNPWSLDHWVGSSSSGSGVATSAGLCYGAIGSDTGGSIRFPSATCGLTGIKPTWGRVSRYGVFPLADSLDHVGPMCRSAADAAAMLGVIAGADPNDPTALQAPVPNYLAQLGGGVRGLRIGVDRSYTQDGIDPQVVAALGEAERALADLGASIREVKFPDYQKLVSQWIPMCSVETAEAHLATYHSRKQDYGPDLAQLIEQGHTVTGVEIAAIHHERLKFSGALAALFEDIDLLLVPTMPVPIPTLTKMGEYGADPNVLLNILRFTAPFDFSGSPTITMPMGMASDAMPLSFQLVGPHLSEHVLARAGHAYQSITDWHTRRPPIA